MTTNHDLFTRGLRVMPGGVNSPVRAFRSVGGTPSFIAGDRDWGIHQNPGALEAMGQRAGADWRGTTLVPGAGHWVQQEKPDEVTRLLLDFLRGLPR